MTYKKEHYGVWYKWYLNKKSAIRNWNSALKPDIYGSIGLDKETCYSDYATKYKPKKYFVLSLSLQSWYKNVIDELNNYLENIQIEVVDERKLYDHKDLIQDYWGKNYQIVFNTEENDKEFALPLIHYNLNNQYTEDSKFVITHELNCFIRLLSPGEDWFKELTSDPFHENYLDNVIARSNNLKYGHSFYEKEFKKEWFKYFDNVELMNKVFVMPLDYKYSWSGRNSYSYNKILDYNGDVPFTTGLIDHLVKNVGK